VTLLAEALTLAAIEVHERGVQDGSRLGRGVDTVQGHGGGGLEREVQADLVVLEGHKRERQGRGPGEEEVDRHKEALLDTCVSSGGRVVEIDQPPVSGLLVGRVVDLRVQTEPVGRDLVDLLTSDLEFDLVRWEMGETSER